MYTILNILFRKSTEDFNLSLSFESVDSGQDSWRYFYSSLQMIKRIKNLRCDVIFAENVILTWTVSLVWLVRTVDNSVAESVSEHLLPVGACLHFMTAVLGTAVNGANLGKGLKNKSTIFECIPVACQLLRGGLVGRQSPRLYRARQSERGELK